MLINPNGQITYISDCYGGRATDKHIVMDARFFDFFEPYDEVIADKGFKIWMASLSIPTSVKTSMQMSSSDVSETSTITNVRIYAEQVIERLK